MSKTKQFLMENYKVINVCALCIALLYGCRIFDATIGLDTEATLEKSANYKEWVIMGRPALYSLKYILGLDEFEPFYSGVTSVIAMLVVIIAWSILISKICPKCKEIALVIFGVSIVTHPVWSEQFYFKCQITEILVGVALVAVAINVTWELIERFRFCTLLLDIVLMVFSFFVYQSMIPLYITGVAITYVLFYFNDKDLVTSRKRMLSIGFLHVIYFVLGFLIYTVLTKVFFSGRSYLGDTMVGWSHFSPETCITYIAQYVKDVTTGEGVYFSWTYSASIVFLAVCVGVFFLSKTQKGERRYFILGLIMVWVSVFFLAVILGKTPVVRSQTSLPFVVAFNLMFTYLLIKEYSKGKFVKYLFGVMLLIILLTQSAMLLRLFYTDYIRNEEDKMLAYRISEQIDYKLEENQDATVVFIGGYKPRLNAACVQGEMIGSTSMFGFCCLNPEINYSSSVRSLLYMRSMGLVYNMPSIEDVRNARELALEMPSWPDKESVVLQDGVVVIKLSNEFDGYSLIEPDANEYQLNEIGENVNFAANIDFVGYDDDNNIRISGWGIVSDCNNYFSNKVLLYNRETNKYYNIPTVCDERYDLTYNCNGVFNYDECGFSAKTSVEKLQLEQNSYEICILNTMNDNTTVVHTEIELSIDSIE